MLMLILYIFACQYFIEVKQENKIDNVVLSA